MSRRVPGPRRRERVPAGEADLPIDPDPAPAVAEPVSEDAGVPEAASADVPAGVQEAAVPSDPAERLAHYRERVLTCPDDADVRHALARLLAELGEHTLSLEQYDALRVAQPEDTVLLLEQSELLVILKRFEPAERELRKLVKLEPENGRAWLQLGIVSFRKGLYAQAEQELRRAVQLLPETSAGYLYRGESLNQLSRVDEALEMMERTIALDPANSRAYYMMGILNDKKGRPQEAMALYRKAREVAAR